MDIKKAATVSLVVAATAVITTPGHEAEAKRLSFVPPSSCRYGTCADNNKKFGGILINKKNNSRTAFVTTNVRGGESINDNPKQQATNEKNSTKKRKSSKNGKKKRQSSSTTKNAEEEDQQIESSETIDVVDKEKTTTAAATPVSSAHDGKTPLHSSADTQTENESKKSRENRQTDNNQQQDQSKHRHHHHHKHRQSKTVEEIIKSDDYYVILGVSKTSTEAQIKKAYRKRAVLTHPDKMEDNDRKAFDKVSEAYDVLSDETKRNVYNRFGKAGLEQGGAGGANNPFAGGTTAEDIFRSFFGGQGFGGAAGQQQYRQQQQQGPINRTVRYQLEVTLEDLYNGLTRNVIVTSQRPTRHPFYPPESADADTTRRRKNVEVHVPRGSIHGQTIVMSGEMDTIPNATPGDIIFILNQRDHPVYTRKNHDLAMELKLSLKEALCGFERTITLLNGKQITVRSATTGNSVPVLIKDGDVQVLQGYGMPKRHYRSSSEYSSHETDGSNNDEYGDLYIQFKVGMPASSSTGATRLSTAEREELGRLLEKLSGTSSKSSSKPIKNISDDTASQDVSKPLQRASASDFGRASGPIHMEEHDDHSYHDEEHQGRQQYHHHRSFFPFGSSSGSQFYYSFGGNSGYQNSADDENVQECAQM